MPGSDSGSDSESPDIKPAVGPLPETTNLHPSSAGKDFFKVELLLGPRGSRQPMLPIKQDNISQELSIEYFVAVEAQPFAIRVKLAKPRSEGTLYGARVYVDSGDARSKYVYDLCKPNLSRSKNQLLLDENSEKVVDQSNFDHFFWIAEGETEYIIEGFYVSGDHTREFVFSKPPEKRKLEDYCEIRDSIGVIRIVFANVTGFKESKKGVFEPKQAEIDEMGLLDRKGKKLSARPGRLICDNIIIPKKEAVLSREVVFERRIIYNTFAGYLGEASTGPTPAVCMHKVNFFQGLPLSCFHQDDVRKKAIRAFLDRVTSSRINMTMSQAIDKGGCVVLAKDGKVAGMNEFVHVEDIVHFISQSLSPAASFMVCTGKTKPGNYGEKIVQRTAGLKKVEKLQDFVWKETGLVSFFRHAPDTYEIVLDGRSELNGTDNYKVRLREIEIDDSDSESD